MGRPVQAIVQVAQIKIFQPNIFERKSINAGYRASLPVAQRSRHIAACAAKIEHTGMFGNLFKRKRMGAGVFEFRSVVFQRKRRAIIAAVIKDAHLLQTRLACGEHYVQRVTQTVNTADFIAVIRGDRQFTDLAFREKHELNNDFGVEMKIV